MGIQTGSGPIRIDPDDLQITHRGKSVAVKIRSMSWPQVLACVNDGSGWKVATDLTGDLFSTDVPGGGDVVAYHLAGDPAGFVRRVIVPNLNAWLATVWTPTGEPVVPLEQLQRAINGLRFVVRTDGTVVVE